MPLVAQSTHVAPFFLPGGHLQTIVPSVLRPVAPLTIDRERIITPDGDFLDIDWSRSEGTRRLAVLSHGLEGHSRQPYMQGMAIALRRRGWDVVAWNFRGCSGEMNRFPRFYHSGATEDLAAVIDHVLAGDARYNEVALIGFSLGGNITLKYLGERGDKVDPRIRGAVAFSVPCDLASSSRKLASWTNRIYMRQFLLSLGSKVRRKAALFPEEIDAEGVDEMRTFYEFDGRYTAPLHGFESAEDYWTRASSKPFLERIRAPALLINARNDPFLSTECFPEAEAEVNPCFFFEAPRTGGHVGFVSHDRTRSGETWSEKRAMEFLETQRQQS